MRGPTLRRAAGPAAAAFAALLALPLPLRAETTQAEIDAAKRRVLAANQQLNYNQKQYNDAMDRKKSVSDDLGWHQMRAQTALFSFMRDLNREKAQSAQAAYDKAAHAAKTADDNTMSSAKEYLDAEEKYKDLTGGYLKPQEVEVWRDRVASHVELSDGTDGSPQNPDPNARLAQAAKDLQNAKSIGAIGEQSRRLGDLTDDMMRQTLQKASQGPDSSAGAAPSFKGLPAADRQGGSDGVAYGGGSSGVTYRADPMRASILLSPQRGDDGRSRPADRSAAARDLLARGDQKGALRSVGEALLANPRDGRAWGLRAQILNGLHRWKDAEEAARKALGLDRGDSQARKDLIWAQLNQKKYDEALKNADLYIQENPGDPQGYLMRAFAYEGLGRRDKMLADLEKAAALDPRYQAHLDLARSGQRLFDPDASDTDRLLEELAVVRTKRTPVLGLGLMLVSLSLGAVWLLWLNRKEELKAKAQAAGAQTTSAPGASYAPGAAGSGTVPAAGCLLAGKYRLTRLEHENESFRLWCSHDVSLGRLVLIKQLLPAPGEDPARARAAFRKEAQVLASLHHLKVVDIYEFLDLPSGFYWVFELVPGRSLRRLLLSEKRLPWSSAVRVISDAAEALGAAHEKGILHRNLRPEHILVTEQGLAKVMEFSPLSKPRATSNPAYSAPELSREPASAASDVYALGACLYEAATGVPPAAPRAPAGSLAPGLPPEAEALLAAALEPDPGRRIRAALEFQRRLTALV